MRREPEIVIFDTNSVRSEGSPDHFLGGREELEKFQKVATIVIPEMVVREVRAQKYRHLTSKKDAFFGNVFHKLFGLDEGKTKQFDVNTHISGLEEAETIAYKVISLNDHSVFKEIERMALGNIPPFCNDSDKGFKDVVIYFTVLEYLKKNPEIPYLFFVTRDSRLTEAFLLNTRVKVVSDFSEFQKYRIEYFTNEYFIEGLASKLEVDVGDIEVHDVWLNVNENWTAQITLHDGRTARVEIDFSSKEVLGYTFDDLTAYVNGFVNSRSFDATHSRIAEVRPNAQYLTDDEIKSVFSAYQSNEQVYWIKGDKDVVGLFLFLSNGKRSLLSDEEVENLKVFYPSL